MLWFAGLCLLTATDTWFAECSESSAILVYTAEYCIAGCVAGHGIATTFPACQQVAGQPSFQDMVRMLCTFPDKIGRDI